MSRLSNNTREQMAKALVRHRYAEQAAELVQTSRDLFKEVYHREHSPTVLKHMAAITKEHRKAFDTRSNLEINVAGRRVTVGQSTIGGYWKVEAENLPTINGVGDYPGVGMAADDELAVRIVTFADANAKLKEDAEIAYREALGTLNQFSTGKALGKDWPEAMPVIGHLIPEDSRTLPVVQVSQLNSKFKLPPPKRG